MTAESFKNPYKPGAGHSPPHLAGRENEKERFSKLLDQDVILKNLIITGLRGTGKTVLLETFKPIAQKKGWLWAGADLSESASVSEVNLAIRLLTDLSVITSNIKISEESEEEIGFAIQGTKKIKTLDYKTLISIFEERPGLVADKLKGTLETVWVYMQNDAKIKGVVFAYDEAQNMSDNADDKQYPLSLLLDVFQSLQKKNIPFLLVLSGLLTLLPKLVETRTYSERMFEVLELKSLSNNESREAIIKPTQREDCPIKFNNAAVKLITKRSGGYPYFIQFICRETFDSFIGQSASGMETPVVPMNEIYAKLETEFFSGRWNNISDRQRELLTVVATLKNSEQEFSIQEVAEQSRAILKKPISNSLINQMFSKLAEQGLVYKTRHGKYILGIPLLSRYILNQGVPRKSG